MTPTIPRGILAAAVALVGIIVGAVVVLYVEGSPEGAALVLAFGSTTTAGVLSMGKITALAKETNVAAVHLANGGTEAIVRKVVGQELAKATAAVTTAAPYVPPPEAKQPASPSTLSGGSELEPGELPPH